MKRLLTIALLLVPSYVWSDTSTSGNLKLLKPSIGVVDPRRSSGDKLNANFEIIDTSFTTLQNGVLASTTALASNLQGQINALSTSQSTQDVLMQNYQSFRSTQDTQSQVFTSFMSTSDAQQTKFVNFNSTSDTHQDSIVNFLSTAGVQMVAVNNFLSTHSIHQDDTLRFLSTAGVNVQQLNLFTSTSDAQQTKFVNFRSTTDSKFDTWANFRSTQDTNIQALNNFLSTHSTHQDATLNFLSTAGVQVQNLNLFTSTSDAQQTKFVNFRSTTDLALASAGGGSLRSYTITLATGYAKSGTADIYDSYGTTNAINYVGAYGLLGGGTTVTATINVREGVYQVKNATIPVGVDFGGVQGSSTVFVLDGNNVTMFTVYGRLHDVVIDCSSIAFKGYMIVLKQGGILDNITYSNCANRATGWGGFLYITSDWVVGGVAPSSVVARVNNMFIPEYKTQPALTASGDNPSLRVVYAQRVEVNNSYFGFITAPQGTVEETASIWRSSRVHFNNCTWDDVAGRGIIVLGQTYDIGFDRSTFNMRRPSYGGAASGVAVFTENSPANISNSISSRTYVTNSTFINHYGTIGRPYIFISATYNSESAYFSGNTFQTNGGTPEVTDTVFSIGAGGLRTLITANRSYGIGTFISDGGTATKYTSLMNFKDGVEQ